MAEYKYKLISTGSSSRKYGNCEVCGGYAEEVWHQIEIKSYSYGYSCYGCSDIFGHKDCLVSKRR